MGYTICSRCVLDSTAVYISFDVNGVCNYCHGYDKLAAETINRPAEIRKKELRRQIKEIKRKGMHSKYDCILGLSGGVDSTYLALLAKQYKLRPLLVHFDNGWNSELAVKNIENIISILGFDLYTYVVNWEEFKDLQLAYLKASVLDIEVPTDQLIFASLYHIAYKNKIKCVLNGNNISTEGVMPKGWNYYDKTDLVNLKSIHSKFGTKKLKNFPKLGLYQRYFYQHYSGIQSYKFLDLIEFNKEEAKQTIKDKLKWTDYGYKHYESIFTRFYQGYILPKKFNVDKRRAHFSTLICSEQMNRQDALVQLELPPYPVSQQLEDKEYVVKKLGLTPHEFEKLMREDIVPHEIFGTQWDAKNFRYYYLFTRFANPLVKLRKNIKSLFIRPSIA